MKNYLKFGTKNTSFLFFRQDFEENYFVFEISTLEFVKEKEKPCKAKQI